MVPKILKSGQSFKGLSDYLAHDSNKAQTKERVAWTHTLNCSHDHVPSAVHEMYTTQLDAEALKREAGLRGRATQKPVKHVSLNWHRDDEPTREHMVETSEHFLKHMGWDEHQAVVYCHTDRHPHVHIMLNAIHPETGRALESSFERRRAQEWALQYERDQEQIRCEERLKQHAEREESLTREAWQQMKEGEVRFTEEEQARRTWDVGYMDRENRKDRETEEWRLLKGHQREEREAFFAVGKTAYAEVRQQVYRDVREEFRNEWAHYYELQREGVEESYLHEMKQGILTRQREVLQERRDAACSELRHSRDEYYAGLLQEQQMARHDLEERQSEGLSSPQLLDLVNGGPPPTQEMSDVELSFGAAAEEVTDRDAEPLTFGSAPVRDAEPIEQARDASATPSRDIASDAASAGIAAFAGVGEKLFDGFFGADGPPKKQPKPTRDPNSNPFARAAEQAVHRAQEDEQKARDRAFWDDRDRSRD